MIKIFEIWFSGNVCLFVDNLTSEQKKALTLHFKKYFSKDIILNNDVIDKYIENVYDDLGIILEHVKISDAITIK